MSYPAYPNQPGGGYPQSGGYPGQQPQQPSYGFNVGGGAPMPGGQPGYPQAGGQPGYPPQGAQQGYPAAPGYPPQNQPPMGGGYPQQQQPQYGAPQYPQQSGYPHQQQQAYPGTQPQYPAYNTQTQQGAYPPQGQTYGQPQYGQQQQPRAQQQQQGYPQMGAPASMASGQTQGSIKPTPGFNAQADAQKLRSAMRGLGCNENEVIGILGKRTANERQQIKLAFKTMFGKDLVKELVSELRGKLEDVAVALMDTPAEFDAKELRHAMAGIGTNEATLIEILSTRTNAEIHAIKVAYKHLFGKDLEKDIKSETSFHFERFLVSLSCGGRDETGQTDVNRARSDAQALLKAGVKKIGTDEGMFNAILVAQNHNQLRLVFQEYQKMAGHDIQQAVRQEFSGDIETGMLTMIKCALNQPAYFAERLYLSMKGMGTQDRNLIRIMISRCEKDMIQIKQEFQKLYGKTLESFISGDTSGKYKQILLALAQGN